MSDENVVVDIDEINEKYEEKSYFARLKLMFNGLSKPRNTPEYKEARLELQRLQAPLIAVVFVVLTVITLIVVSQIQDEEVEEYKVSSIEKPKEEEEPPEEEDKETPPDPEVVVDPNITVDTVMPGPPTEVANPTPAPAQPVSVKPAPVNAVAHVVSPVKLTSMLGSRTPGSIGAKLTGGAGDGDAVTEAAVLKVLWWLKANQNQEGTWPGGHGHNKLANAAFAVLTYLAHGEYPNSPSPYKREFGPVVEKALEFIMNSVQETKTPVRMHGADGNEYAFLIATYALCEAYGMTKNPDIKDKAFVCLERIIKGQSSTGGWDYHIDPSSTRDDLSFAGWALQALKAGKLAGLQPEGLDECIKKAIRCLQKRNFVKGGFGYTAHKPPDGLTATGCLAMQLLGYGNAREVAESLNFMRKWTPAFKFQDMNPNANWAHKAPQYYCYYATQCKYQAGMKEGASKIDIESWYEWNKAMKALYPKSINELNKKGYPLPPVKDLQGKDHKQGYYVNTDAWSSRPVMDTCLVALQLMVYYRYLPTTQKSAGKVASDKDEDSTEKAVDSGDVGVQIDDF